MQTKIKNVLSLFDGMSCGQLALKRAGVMHGTYYAAEIFKGLQNEKTCARNLTLSLF